MITIPGEPQGKARARVVRGQNGRTHSYTPKKTELYENLIKIEYRLQNGEFFGTDDKGDKKPLKVRIYAYFGMPKNFSKKKRAAALDGFIFPTKKPDADNIAKCVCDALNGVAYIDDTQIIDLGVFKAYGEKPRVEIEIKEIEEEMF